MEPISVAVVGAGNMAKEHLSAFSAIPGVTIAGIFSRTKMHAETLARDYNIAEVCESIQDLYSRTRAQLVLVTVDEPSMLSVNLACLEHPWAIFTEKPPGIDLAEAMLLQRKAEESEALLMVGLNRRFLSSSIAAKEDLDQINEPRFVQVYDQQDLVGAKIYGHAPAVINNWMYANSIHTIDYFLQFGRGKIENVEKIKTWDPKNPTLVISAITFTSGDYGLYQAIWDGPGPWAATITTSQKRWELRPLETAKYQARGERRLSEVSPRDDWDLKFKPGFRRQAEAVIAAVRQEKGFSPNIADAVEVMQLINAIYS